MPEFPFELEDREVQARLESRIDPEGKISRALAELGQLEGRRALLPDVGKGLRAGQLRAAGAIVVAPAATQAAPPERYVSFWGGLHPDASDPDGLLERIRGSLAPDGRILLVHDYGRDDASRLLGDRAREERRIAWSNRKGWFLERGLQTAGRPLLVGVRFAGAGERAARGSLRRGGSGPGCAPTPAAPHAQGRRLSPLPRLTPPRRCRAGPRSDPRTHRPSARP